MQFRELANARIGSRVKQVVVLLGIIVLGMIMSLLWQNFITVA